jgi:SNF2 family DNA or RNA helicase
LSRIAFELEKQGIKYCYIDGQTKKRQEQVEQFQTDPEYKVFLISLKAGGVGLNLTAAEYVFIYDPWWNPAAEAQAIDRAHRIGQDKTVFVYRYIVKNTIEEKIQKLQASKKLLVDNLLDSSSLFADLNFDQIQDLLS